ncbi:hypothetical protein Emtol_1746 [Emticicia oligotrophica DSM 17448]|uniref:Uncharacterized protein n=1 Tax=Emticicia oligotrophica (strain DSM 17448 / CIP 109782 / MTCC 6937 / GPTSA100-15) TaxID=929562 RepID=A0ABM5N0R9_EMTOG|nr:hypothetical protein [Emticicia oligotrophica]AFK02888.1 hypothetical protein Emtol_1746 [Emticicia oligotrophica DSM 17448]
MKYIIIMSFLALVACAKEMGVDDTLPPLASKVELSFDTELTFQEGVKIKVTKVEDSRCPQNTTCIWAGMARVFFTITDKGVSKDSSIDFEAKPINTTVDINGVKYQVEITDVLPYPKNATSINQNDYKVSTTVKKL